MPDAKSRDASLHQSTATQASTIERNKGEKYLYTSKKPLYQPILQWIDFARGCMRTSGDWDRRNGTAGQRMERADAPVPGRRCQRAISGWTESEATQMPLWMHLHQR